MLKLSIYTIIASVIAGCGLISNSMPAIIASMIVSPLLQPIANKLVGKHKIKNSKLITLMLILLAIFTGFVIGMLNNVTELFNYETESMNRIADLDVNNKKYMKLLTEFVIAIAVGIGLPFAILNQDATLLVAFGIAPSITPPLVNCGLYLANSLKYKSKEHLHKSGKSLLLGSMHMIVIFVIALIYKIFLKNKFDKVIKKK